MAVTRTWLSTLVLVAIVYTRAFCQPTETSRTLDCGGAASSNAMFRCVSAIGQGVPIIYTSNSQHLNQLGFLVSDTLNSSVAQDSDGDGIGDWTELKGTDSSPVQPSSIADVDSDGDAFIDPDELRAGTNPMNPDSLLAFSSITADSGKTVVTWKARKGKTYELVGAGSVEGLVGLFSMARLTAHQGQGPWMATTLSYTNTISPLNFFRVYLDE